ncbi:hypothetical protein [Circoviridae sp.]|nr:hypothetical protein [Circoviridae sp.]
MLHVTLVTWRLLRLVVVFALRSTTRPLMMDSGLLIYVRNLCILLLVMRLEVVGRLIFKDMLFFQSLLAFLRFLSFCLGLILLLLKGHLKRIEHTVLKVANSKNMGIVLMIVVSRPILILRCGSMLMI